MKSSKLFLLLIILKCGNCTKDQNARPECALPNNSTTVSINDILKLGENSSGDSGTTSIFPCWFNLDLSRTGQIFAQKYYGQILFANVMSLILLLSDYQTRRVLFLTQKSETPDKASKRYLATAQQIHLWYHSDILSPDWAKSVTNVRKVHSYASFYVDSLNGTESKLTATPKENPTGFQPNERLWSAFKLDLGNFDTRTRPQEFDYSAPKFKFNQYTMAMTIWAFMALPVLNPEPLGIARPSEKELQGYAHLWAVIAYAVGTDEQYIFCKDPQIDWQKCKSYLMDLFREHILPQLMNLDFEGELMIESMLSGISKIIPRYPVDALLINLLEEHLGVRATNLRRQRTLQSRVFGTIANNFVSRYSNYFRPVRWLAGKAMFAELQLASRKVFRDFGTNFTVVANKHFYS
ncbi:unnamed protein product [Allacma fusca]|uniref:ER-bound oxygenase mpaB/mpaB'/Rubber oxygenase catalytic domain-containing protein n=1 Tax=Allacma fusca TaxID=39272 RepID=A0A8J2JNC0_9HEXA|nr:unnamed protein product [Allacma fusca]